MHRDSEWTAPEARCLDDAMFWLAVTSQVDADDVSGIWNDMRGIQREIKLGIRREESGVCSNKTELILMGLLQNLLRVLLCKNLVPYVSNEWKKFTVLPTFGILIYDIPVFIWNQKIVFMAYFYIFI